MSKRTEIFSRENKALINQIRKFIGITPNGHMGFGSRLINDTGAPSVKGTVVEPSSSIDFGFDVAGAGDVDPIGIVFDDGIADGELCLVIMVGIAQVLLEDTTASTHGNWVQTSNSDAGRADATAGSPAAAPTHFEEIGHCIESKGAGTDVLAECVIHFL